MDAHDENSRSSPHKRTENVSLRLDKDIVAELRREAEQNQINLNTLANQIFDSYVNFANSASNGMIPVSKAIMVELVEGYGEAALKSIIDVSVGKLQKRLHFSYVGALIFKQL